MKLIEIAPIHDTPSDYDAIESAIVALFRREIYVPLIELLGPSNLINNSMEDLKDAIARGTITFDRGKFTGRFNARTSREIKRLGGKFKGGAWYIPLSELSVDIGNVIRASKSLFEKKMAEIDSRLARISPEEVSRRLKMNKLFDRIIYRTDKSIAKSMDNLTVMHKLGPEERAKIAEEYTENMRFYIKNWTENQIVELREKIQKSTFKGERYEGMVKTIRDSYGVSQRKAKFLARQETNILMAKFKNVRYSDAGIKQYKWKCVTGTPQHPVRPRHKELNDRSAKGELFNFDDPPKMEDGQAKNPGEDYGCRCVAIPVVRF